MHDRFAALLRQPTARRYKQLRSQLLSGGSLGDFSLRLASYEQAITAGEDAADLLSDLLGEGLLSLRLHRVAGLCAADRGDARRAELHRFTYDALLAAIRATGNGTRSSPFVITYGSDSAELLAASGFRVLAQSLVEANDRRYDVLLTDNEREFWFDVTDFLPQPAVVQAPRRAPTRTAARAKKRLSKAVSRS
jgi:hypothetical protein